MTPDDPRDVEIARKTVQVGVLEQRVWELREELARAQRHRGAAVGLLRGALKDGALAGDYADLAERVVEQADAQTCPFAIATSSWVIPDAARAAAMRRPISIGVGSARGGMRGLR